MFTEKATHVGGTFPYTLHMWVTPANPTPPTSRWLDPPLAHSSATSMDDGLIQLKSNQYGFPDLPWLPMVVISSKIINPNGYFSECFLFRKVFIPNFRSKNLSE